MEALESSQSETSHSGRRQEAGATSPQREGTDAPNEVQRLRQALERSESQLAERDREVESLRSLNKDLIAHKQDLERAMKAIVDSKSWKLTAPLRGVIALAKAMLPLLRFKRHRMKLEASRGVTLVPESKAGAPDGNAGQRFSIDGPSPYMLMESEDGAVPRGWVQIRGDFQTAQSHMFFFLYHRSGEGFHAQERFLIPFSSTDSKPHLLRLPKTTLGLRLDPFDTKGEFTFKRLEIREIGTLQVLLAILKKQLTHVWRDPRALFVKAKKFFTVLREGGFVALRVKLFADNYTSNYQEWVKNFDTLTDEDRNAIKRECEALQYRPLISVVMPTYNTPERWLRPAIESVLKQCYGNWELCIADDCSREPHVKAILEEYAAKDSRVKFCIREKNGHISQASNSALALASGEFVALLDHDDELTEDALYMVVRELNEHREADLIYSDEDKLTGYGMRFNPYFKSGWNPELFLAQNFICHLGVYRRSIVQEIGGFREGFDGAQDWDLALRVIDKIPAGHIRHIPHILYHWRVIEGSTAQSTAFKPYVMEAQKKAVGEHLERRGIKNAKVSILEHISQLKVTFPLPERPPLVSIIIPTRDQLGLLKRCVSTIREKTSYKNFEIIIVDNGSVEKETLEYLQGLQQRGEATIIRDTKPFNFSRINNLAVKQATGEILAFLNNDLEVIDGGWLAEMVSYAVRPEIGAVGARLLYPNNHLQHAGVILGIGGVAGHNHKGISRHDPGYFNRAILPQNLSAVTAACMLVRREVFEAVNGFDEVELSVAFNDVDLCIRIREKGFRNVYTPYAELYHYESASRGYENTPEKFLRFEKEIVNMKRRWERVLQCDPYYNPNLTLLSEDFTFSFPPRVQKPWKANRKAD